jgi:hypothetical protein
VSSRVRGGSTTPSDLAAWESRLLDLRRAVEQARIVQECLHVADAAEGYLALLRLAGRLVHDQNAVAVMKVDAERKAGELLLGAEKHPGAATRCHDETALPPTYRQMAAELGRSLSQFKNIVSGAGQDEGPAGPYFTSRPKERPHPKSSAARSSWPGITSGRTRKARSPC